MLWLANKNIMLFFSNNIYSVNYLSLTKSDTLKFTQLKLSKNSNQNKKSSQIANIDS